MGGISISSIDRKGKTAAAPVIKLESSVLFLNEHLSSLPFASRRSAAADEGVPAGATLRGSVNLDLPQARCVKSITVELVGELKAVYPSGDSEQLETLRHEVDLLYSHSPFLPAGPTSLEFAIQLASDTPPSFSCRFGTQRYSLRAIVEEHSGKTNRSKEVEATIIYAGGSRYREAHLVDISENDQGIGSFVARLATEQPSVGSPLAFFLHIPTPRIDATLLQIQISAIETLHIRPTSKAAQAKAQPKHLNEISLLRLYNTPDGLQTTRPRPGVMEQSQPWKHGDQLTVDRHLRLPPHKTFSASTPRAQKSKSPLTISHCIRLSMRYRLPSGELKDLQISKDFMLLSCKCLADNFVAPPYALKDPLSRLRFRQALASDPKCACKLGDAPQLSIPAIDEILPEHDARECQKLRIVA